MGEKCAIILAAGDGKRMKSTQPKVLCQVLFTPMLTWVLDNCKAAEVADTCVVVGSGAAAIEAILPSGVETALQAQRLGTGHAVLCAESFLQKHKDADVLVLCGDAPLLGADSINKAYAQHVQGGFGATVITAHMQEPTGYGRIVRDENSQNLLGIVEEKDATAPEKTITEINSGAYWFKAQALLDCLKKLSCNNAQGEYYLTDVVALMRAQGLTAAAAPVATELSVKGANDRMSLHELNEIARYTIIGSLLEQGVNIPCIDGVIIGPNVRIGQDTTILPNTIIRGDSIIGTSCEIGPSTTITDARIGSDCVVNATQIANSVLDDHVKIGPFSQVRPGSHLKTGVKVGNFVEIKNAVLGKGTKSAHLTYIGDADVGENVNFGCGVVVVNYDGFAKHRTIIGDDCFIGCNTNLVAPITVGNKAYTAAGSTVTQNVPDDSLVIARAREVVKENATARLTQSLGANARKDK